MVLFLDVFVSPEFAMDLVEFADSHTRSDLLAKQAELSATTDRQHSRTSRPPVRRYSSASTRGGLWFHGQDSPDEV